MIRLAFATSALLLAALTAFAQPAATERFRGDPVAGRAIALRWCVSCHTLPGVASGSDVAPSFRAIALDRSKDADHLRGFLSHPHWPMPPLQLGRTEIENIVAYLAELSRTND